MKGPKRGVCLFYLLPAARSKISIMSSKSACLVTWAFRPGSHKHEILISVCVASHALTASFGLHVWDRSAHRPPTLYFRRRRVFRRWCVVCFVAAFSLQPTRSCRRCPSTQLFHCFRTRRREIPRLIQTLPTVCHSAPLFVVQRHANYVVVDVPFSRCRLFAYRGGTTAWCCRTIWPTCSRSLGPPTWKKAPVRARASARWIGVRTVMLWITCAARLVKRAGRCGKWDKIGLKTYWSRLVVSATYLTHRAEPREFLTFNFIQVLRPWTGVNLHWKLIGGHDRDRFSKEGVGRLVQTLTFFSIRHYFSPMVFLMSAVCFCSCFFLVRVKSWVPKVNFLSVNIFLIGLFTVSLWKYETALRYIPAQGSPTSLYSHLQIWLANIWHAVAWILFERLASLVR